MVVSHGDDVESPMASEEIVVEGEGELAGGTGFGAMFDRDGSPSSSRLVKSRKGDVSVRLIFCLAGEIKALKKLLFPINGQEKILRPLGSLREPDQAVCTHLQGESNFPRNPVSLCPQSSFYGPPPSTCPDGHASTIFPTQNTRFCLKVNGRRCQNNIPRLKSCCG